LHTDILKVNTDISCIEHNFSAKNETFAIKQ